MLKEVILTQQNQLKLGLGIPREVAVKPLKRFALVVSGLRRSGKSTLLRQILHGQIVCYIRFEDIRLSTFESRDFTKLDQVFLEALGEKGVYLLDEVQNVDGWEVYVRSLVDAGKQVYITGSNATLMSKELATRLTGRTIRLELFPFDFSEFCKARGRPSRDLFDDYLKSGGIPEYVLQKDDKILESLLEDIIYKDVLVRHKIRDESIVKSMVSYLLTNIGKELSFNKLRDIFGMGSANTVIDIVSALEDSYLLFTVNQFSYSLKKQLRNQRKVYCVDNGLITKASFRTSDDLGRLLENVVYVALRRKNLDIFYFKGKKECDFVVMKGNAIVEAVQVCYVLTQDNLDREIQGLAEALTEHKLKKGLILTYDQTDEFTVDGKKITVKPVWRWLLEDRK